MKSVRVAKKFAESVRNFLSEGKYYDCSRQPVAKGNFIYFPISSGAEPALKKSFGGAIVVSKAKLPSRKQHTVSHQQKHVSSYDVIGDIAVIEIPKNLVKHQKSIALSILKHHKNISTVLKKKAGHEGQYRLQQTAYLAGRRKHETIHREHGCSFRMDVEKVYFSPRLSTERKRIFSQVKKGEEVMVMFSGCGVYPIAIAKNSMAKSVYGIELNPVAHKYAMQNISLNKAGNVGLYHGDAGKVMLKLKKKYDRIAMPLPKGGASYLSAALKSAKRGTIIHLYDFSYLPSKKDKPTGTFTKISKEAVRAKRKYRMLRWVKCGQIAPKTFRICVDFKLLN